MSVFDRTRCLLGEGPLWHPERGQLFWFDIPNGLLLGREDGETRRWQFDEPVSAAGWIDATALLVASKSALVRVDLNTGARTEICPLEAGNPRTRSNDGRTDPWGGFWIGTMALDAETGAGAIYRYYRGELRQLFGGISIPNAISFDPDASFACFCDGREHVIRRIRLDDADGWPRGDSEIFIDMRQDDWAPDGAVMDVEGNFWNAQWGAGRVAVYNRAGEFLREVPLPARKTSCPAFGGDDLGTLYVTSASQELAPEELARRPESGMTFAVEGVGRGQPEHRVIL